ncbi:MAG: hypothetical protein KGL39_46320 [Patescibacteria group bacterium]|nr:hypothetical protein [Patescibacteria group bacterium]
MALNGAELLVIDALLRRSERRARVLSLGYPDLLITPEFCRRRLPSVDPASIALRPDGVRACEQHSFRAKAMFESHSFFAAIGAQLTVLEPLGDGFLKRALTWRFSDLNRRLWTWRGGYDLVIDPGTVEHCFNVARAMLNVARLVRRGGYVYHQAAISFPNHGFFSISPTFFADFYEHRGFDLARPLLWDADASLDDLGIARPVSDIDAFEECNFTGGPVIGMYLARKSRDAASGWPIQRKYRDAPLPLFSAELDEIVLEALAGVYVPAG